MDGLASLGGIRTKNLESDARDSQRLLCDMSVSSNCDMMTMRQIMNQDANFHVGLSSTRASSMAPLDSTLAALRKDFKNSA